MRRISIISAVVLGLVASAVPAGAASPTPGPSPTAGVVPGPVAGDLWLSEIFPNPVGTDTGNEWVELSNRTTHTVAIGGMTVARVSGTTLLTVPSGTMLGAGAYLKLTATGSIINGGDTVLLKLGSTEYDRITYDGTGEEGQAWARLSETVGEWTETPTPDAPNQFTSVVEGEDEVTTAVSSKATASSAKPAAKSAKPTAAKLPKSGPGLLAYLIIPLAWAVYGYGRRYFQNHADDR